MDEAFLNDLLECSVCLEQLDGSSKVLPCQHTFCKRCLEEIVHSHKELRCPECRVLVETKVDDLPPNILLIRLLEGIKNNPRLKPVGSSVRKTDSNISQPLSPPRASQVHNTRQVTPVNGEQPKTTPKQPLHTPPFAKAMYTYEGKEPGDLTFKKGDMIILQRRIDQNWYHGEVNGKYGFVPARYVRVVVPLPTHVPQCKALYDFSVAENEEKDCLTFKKGEVITVIRRVDDNWAEGKSGDRIGIFPMSFVEMNIAARSLMKLSVNTQQGPSRVAPPTPMMITSQIPLPPHSKADISSTTVAPQIPESLSSATTTPSPSSSTTPSPSTPPSSSNSSSSLPLVPPVSSVATFDRPPSVLTRSASQRTSHQREKRHSLSSISSSSCQKSPHIPVTHKHSSEILSTSGGDILAAPNRTISDNPVSTTSPCLPFSSSPFSSKNVKDDVAARPAHRHSHRSIDFSRNSATATAATCTTTTVTVSKATSSTTNPTQGIPAIIRALNRCVHKIQNLKTRHMAGYVALYNYRPQKDDELELKKGEFYTVSEKCQDGWFKGNCLRTGSSGVFPGNYVHVAAKSSAHQSQHGYSYPAVANVRSTGSKSLLPVASIPPRQKLPAVSQPAATVSSTGSGLMSTVYSHAMKPIAQEPRTSVAAGLLEWARSVTATTSSPQKPHANYMPAPAKQDNSKENGGVLPFTPVSKPPDINHWVENIPSAVTTTTVATPLAHMSSMAISYPSANTHHDSMSTNCSPASISQSWHAGKVHGGSFLSHAAATTVMPPPNVSLRASSSSGHSSHNKTDKHKVRKEKTRESLMKRFTGKKKTSLHVSDFSCDNPSFVDSPTPQSSGDPIHVRSGSCPTEALTGQSNHQPQSKPIEASVTETPKSGSRLKQPSLVRERFRCVVPYPPNSEYELELKVGDVVYVHKKREDGWYKGTLLRTGKTGLFPASFVDSF